MVCGFTQAHGVMTTMRSGLVGNKNKSMTSTMVLAKDTVVDFLTELGETEGAPMLHGSSINLLVLDFGIVILR